MRQTITITTTAKLVSNSGCHWLGCWWRKSRLGLTSSFAQKPCCELIWPVVNKKDQHVDPADFWLQSGLPLRSGAAVWIYIYLHINASVMYLFSCVLLILRVQGLQHFALIQLPHWIHSCTNDLQGSLSSSALHRVSSSRCRLVSVGPTLSCFHAWRFQQLSGAAMLFSTVSLRFSWSDPRMLIPAQLLDR